MKRRTWLPLLLTIALFAMGCGDNGDIVAGSPFVANARVVGVVDGEARGPKIRVFKKKRRKGFRKTRGHRSVFTRVRITDIQV